jgi:hypothetical protein
MSFLGPDWNPKPGWKQRWWWRERRPSIIAVVLLTVGMVLAVLIPLAVTGAFDDDHKPAQPSGNSNSDPTTQSSTGLPRPTEKPPELPDTVRKPTPEGIEATIRFEIEALNYAQRTGDLEPVKSVYNMTSCRFCKLLVEELSNSLQNGATYVDAEYTITSIDPLKSVNESGDILGYANTLEMQPKDAILVDPNGKQLNKRPADPEVKSFYTLDFLGGKWVIQEVS